MDARILDDGATRRHNAGHYLCHRAYRYALFGSLLYTDEGLVREKGICCLYEILTISECPSLAGEFSADWPIYIVLPWRYAMMTLLL